MASGSRPSASPSTPNTDAKGQNKAAPKEAAADGKAEAAECAIALLAGDESLQAAFVAEGGLAAACAMLREEATKAAAERLLNSLEPCFDDLIEAAKKKK
eukprot:scaffold156039_cov24-Tisochrysis_lutea.AAC.2